MDGFGDVRDLFAVEGFQPETWQRHARVLEVSGIIRLDPMTRHKVLVVVHPPDGDLSGASSVGSGWVRPRPTPAQEEALSRVLGSVLDRIREREPAIRRWMSLTGEPRRTLAWEFSREHVTRPVPEPLIQGARDPTTDEIRIGLFLRSPCLQDCRFCPPENRTRSGEPEGEEDLAFVRRLADQVFRPARKRGVPVTVTLRADDLLGHGRLPEILDLLHREAGCPIHLVTPVNRAADGAAARRAVQSPGVESVAFTLFAASASVHDVVAGRPGAFRETLRAARWLSRMGTVESRLRFVVTRPGLSDLRAVADTALALGASFTIAGLVADTSEHLDRFGGLLPRLDLAREAFEEAAPILLRLDAEVVDIPLCAIPPALRERAVSRRARDRTLVGYATPEACRRCTVREDCLGVPRTYLDDHGEEGLVPL